MTALNFIQPFKLKDGTTATHAATTLALYPLNDPLNDDDNIHALRKNNKDDSLGDSIYPIKDNATADASENALVPMLIAFHANDPDNPNNWPSQKKIGVIAILCSLSFCSVFGSSSYAPGETQIQKTYGVNASVASLGLTVYVLGFAFGPLGVRTQLSNLHFLLTRNSPTPPLPHRPSGPMSEMYGRRLPYLVSWPLLIGLILSHSAFEHTAVIAPSAWVDNLAVIMVIISLLNKLLWVVRVHWFFVIALWPLVFFIPETHGLTILARRAKKLRDSGTTNAYAAHELHTLSRKEFLWGHIGRPITMLFMEPIIIGVAIWVSLAYSIVYFFFEAYPVVFVEQNHADPLTLSLTFLSFQNHISFQLGGLPFLGIMVGMFLCLLTMGIATQYTRRITIPFIDPPGVGTPVDAPEAGLKVALLDCILLPISMFWFAWTSRGNVHWISPALAGVLFGFAMLGITYRMYASSATASNTLARSISASAFPILAHPIINNLGTAWGVSIFGFLSLGLIPIPLVFIRYGPALRAKSFYAREAARVMEGMQHKPEDEVILLIQKEDYK
ncbi:hypothetical protein EW145_g6492 [Phellinidium pouzarii]|uniref:Major facilitator superfamily (MFS) profile domain-containing protein n=1 Tax=Phellinidium pouzarii TaxID=167371 RepID=A0A4S4KWN2_9AGAM|nr:hypothetical protein EW145_g6492 [Phellinidium pouzarii]